MIHTSFGLFFFFFSPGRKKLPGFCSMSMQGWPSFWFPSRQLPSPSEAKPGASSPRRAKAAACAPARCQLRLRGVPDARPAAGGYRSRGGHRLPARGSSQSIEGDGPASENGYGGSFGGNGNPRMKGNFLVDFIGGCEPFWDSDHFWREPPLVDRFYLDPRAGPTVR